MKTRSTLFTLFSLLIVASLTLAACTPSVTPTAAAPTQPPADQPTTAPAPADPTAAPAADQVTIKVVSFLTYSDQSEGAENDIVKAFEAAHPNIKVDFQLLPFGDYFTTLKTRIAGGDAPDVASLNMENVQEFASLGALTDLTPFIEKENFDLDAYYENTLKMHQYQGKQVGLPASFSDVVMFYNKDIFDKAELAYPDGTWDWDKYIETAKQLTVDENQDGVVEQFGTARAWWPLYLFWNGANIFTPDMKQCGLTDPAAIEGLQRMVDMTLKDKIAPAQKDLDAQDDYHMFMSGRIAMYPIGPWAINDFNTITTFTWDVADMPAMKNQATFLFGNAYSILSETKNPDAAWEFIKFATGEEGDLIRQKAGYEIAPNKKVAESEFLKSLEGKMPEHASIFLSATSYAQTVPVVPHWTEIHDAINNELTLALLGNQTIEQAVAKACPTVDTLLAEGN